MTGEALPDPHSELRAEFEEKLAAWAEYFATSDVEESRPVQGLAIVELDNLWERLGNGNKNFVVYGHGTWGEFVESDSDEPVNELGYKEHIASDNQAIFAHSMPQPIRQYVGEIAGLKGESIGFQIAEIEDGLAPRLCYMFLKDEIMYMLGDNASAVVRTFINCDVTGAVLLEQDTFDMQKSAEDIGYTVVDQGADDPAEYEDESEDGEEEIVDESGVFVVQHGAEIADTLSKMSDDFLQYTRRQSFRRRSIAKQYELLERRLQAIESAAQIFGQAALIEAEYFLVNSGATTSAPTYRSIPAGEVLPIQGLCGGLVLPWMHDIYRNGIKRDDDWFYMAGGLCLAVLPFAEIVVPQTQEVITPDQNIFVPISGQHVQAHIYPIKP